MSDWFEVTQLVMMEPGLGRWSMWLQPLPSFSCPFPLPLASLGDTGKALKFCCLFGFVVLLIHLPAGIAVNKLRKNKEKALSRHNWRKNKHETEKKMLNSEWGTRDQRENPFAN